MIMGVRLPGLDPITNKISVENKTENTKAPETLKPNESQKKKMFEDFEEEDIFNNEVSTPKDDPIEEDDPFDIEDVFNDKKDTKTNLKEDKKDIKTIVKEDKKDTKTNIKENIEDIEEDLFLKMIEIMIRMKNQKMKLKILLI